MKGKAEGGGRKGEGGQKREHFPPRLRVSARDLPGCFQSSAQRYTVTLAEPVPPNHALAEPVPPNREKASFLSCTQAHFARNFHVNRPPPRAFPVISAAELWLEIDKKSKKPGQQENTFRTEQQTRQTQSRCAAAGKSEKWRLHTRGPISGCPDAIAGCVEQSRKRLRRGPGSGHS